MSRPLRRSIAPLLTATVLAVNLLPVALLDLALGAEPARRLTLLAPQAITPVTFEGMTPEGGHLVVSANEDLVTGIGSQPGIWDHVAGRLVERLRTLATVKHVTSTGSIVVSTDAGLVPEDPGQGMDLYLIDDAGPHLLTPGTQANLEFVHAAADLSSIVIRTTSAVTTEDGDTTPDYYRFDLASGMYTLLTPGMSNPSFAGADVYESRVLFRSGLDGVVYERVGDAMVDRGDLHPFEYDTDGTIYLETLDPLVAGDTDAAYDAYAWDEDGFDLLSDGIEGDIDAIDVSRDGTRLLLRSDAPLVASDTDGMPDLYLRHDGVVDLVSLGDDDVVHAWGDADLTTVVFGTTAPIDPGDDGGSEDLFRWSAAGPGSWASITKALGGPGTTVDAVSADGRRIIFEASRAVLPDDVPTGYTDIYEWHDGAITNLTPGTPTTVTFLGASTDGRRVVFRSSETLVEPDLVPGGIYVSDADVDAPTATITGPPGGASGAVATFVLDTTDHDGVWFECWLDSGAPVACPARPRFTGLTTGSQTLHAYAWDPAGNRSEVPASRMWKVDPTIPKVAAPSSEFAKSSANRSSVPLALSWAPISPKSMVDHYEVAAQADGGPWVTKATGVVSPHASVAVSIKHEWQFRVRAIDGSGNAGPWKTGHQARLDGRHEDSRMIRYSGTWKTATGPYWGGAARRSSTAGAKATIKADMRSIGWVGRLSSGGGRAKVYVDGKLVAKVSLAAAPSGPRVVWSRTWSSAKVRTVTIKVLGGTHRGPVTIDEFLVLD